VVDCRQGVQFKPPEFTKNITHDLSSYLNALENLWWLKIMIYFRGVFQGVTKR